MSSEAENFLTFTRGWARWLYDQRITLAATSYKTGGVFFFGTKFDEQNQLTPAILQRHFDRAMGVCRGGDGSLWLASRNSVYRFAHFPSPGGQLSAFDAVFVPRTNFFTADIDAHDLALGAGSAPLVVATKLNAVVTLDNQFSCQPVWMPPFITELKAEDRCHLNGLAVQDGKLAFVTSVSQSDVMNGWKDARTSGGVIINAQTNEVVMHGLSMPHSPRCVGTGDQQRVYFLHAGTGKLCRFDPAVGRDSLEEICFIPGFARGLTLYKNFAFVASSLPDGHATSGLSFLDDLSTKGANAQCGIFAVSLDTGNIDHAVKFEKHVTELFDVEILPDIRRPYVLGTNSAELDNFHAFNQSFSPNKSLN